MGCRDTCRVLGRVAATTLELFGSLNYGKLHLHRERSIIKSPRAPTIAWNLKCLLWVPRLLRTN